MRARIEISRGTAIVDERQEHGFLFVTLL
eukprot:COSAG02_NODE_20604_length_823_cov_1.266575_1_plen_28_part_10